MSICGAAVQRIWHIDDSHDRIMAMTFSGKIPENVQFVSRRNQERETTRRTKMSSTFCRRRSSVSISIRCSSSPANGLDTCNALQSSEFGIEGLVFWIWGEEGWWTVPSLPWHTACPPAQRCHAGFRVQVSGFILAS